MTPQAGSAAPLDVWHVVVGLTRGGAERLLVEVLPHLRALGVSPKVVSLKGWGPIGDDLLAAGVPVLSLGGAGKGDPRPLFRLTRAVRAERPALLHAHLTRAVIAAGWVSRRTGVPLLAHFHSLAGQRRSWRDRLEAASARRARVRIAVSAAVATDRARLFDLPVESFQVVPNGIDSAPFRSLPAPAFPSDRSWRVGFLGRLRKEKGIDLLLEAAARLRRREGKGPRLSFEIAGGPEAAQRSLAARIARQGLIDSVSLLGEVADPVACLSRWQILVLPSRREGFGLALIEAMAAARPVVAARAGGIPEVVVDGENGLLVPSDDAGALAEALASLAADPERARRLGMAGRKRVSERFEARITAEDWANLAREAAA